MAALVTLDEAKLHLRVTGDYDDADITSKLTQASAIVLDYILQPVTPWTTETAPWLVKAGVLLSLGELYDNRDGSLKNEIGLSQSVKNVLHRLRDPALA